MNIRLKVVENTSEYWFTNNPVIPLGEAAVCTDRDQNSYRIGDGVHKYTELQAVYLSRSILATDEEGVAGIISNRATTPKQVTVRLDTLKTEIDGNMSDLSTDLTAKITQLETTMNTKFSDMTTKISEKMDSSKITISTAEASGTGSPKALWFQYS